jgi:hypothetical protein
MKRYYLARGYTLLVGLGLFVLGVLGFAPPPPSMAMAENLMHIATGSLFLAGASLMSRPNQLQGFLFGMGILLVLAKVLIVVARWPEHGLHLPLVGVICLVVGVSSLLIASLVGSEPPRA